jgi:hypothetical protein
MSLNRVEDFFIADVGVMRFAWLKWQQTGPSMP